MPRRRRLFLPFPEWPAADKSMWMKAFAPGADLFDEGGLGAHLSNAPFASCNMRTENFFASYWTSMPIYSRDLLPNG